MKKTTTFFSKCFVRKSGILCMGIFAFTTANLFGQTTFNYTGSLQTYTVPAGVTSIRIDASGAQGGSVTTTCNASGGLGADMVGDFAVTPGEVLSIMVGQQGLTNGSDAGGGGGTFVVRTGNVCLVAAGGGGGATNNITSCGSNRDGLNATITTSGTASANGLVAGGTGGNGGGASTGSGGGGGGFLTDGTAGTGLGGNNGKSYLNGGAGGTGNNNDFGGYGGGGAGWFTGGNGGGGGGYSGGGTSGAQPYSGGGGGGSFNAGTNQTNTAGFQNGNGRVIITVLYSASITQTQQVLCFGQSNGSLTATPVGGSGPFTYAWSPTGGTAATASGLGAGTYTVTITDATMATATQTFTITQPSALSVASSQTNISCNGGNNGDAMVTVSGGTPGYTYSWSPSGGNAAMAMGLSANSYSCITTDANGCTITQTFSITQPSALIASTSQIDAPCNGSTNGNASVSVSGGTPGYTYAWSPTGGNAAMSTGIGAGSYTCTITDANSCVLTKTFTITEPYALTVISSSTDVICNGGNTGTANVLVSGGTSPYAYSWSPSGGTSPMVMGLIAGTYTCNISDVNGCTTFANVFISEPLVLTSFATATPIFCNGGSSIVTVTASGGVAPYVGAGTFTVTAGTYNNLVTDANGCTSLTPSITITEPTAIIISTNTASGPSTCGGTNGNIDISVSGGTPGYTFMWSNSATTEDISGLVAGNYVNTISDANGCFTTFSVTVSDPTPPTVTMSLPTSNVCADDGNVTLSGGLPAGGVYSGPAVTAGVFNPSTSVLGANTITYTYTDPNTQCSASATSVITVNACTGVQSQITNENNFLVIPNPNNGTFQLQLNTTGVADVLIYDNMGKLVSAQKVQPNVQQEVTISTSGIYLISVITADGQRSSQRVVVSK